LHRGYEEFILDYPFKLDGEDLNLEEIIKRDIPSATNAPKFRNLPKRQRRKAIKNF
jgi:hypothetical protein